MSEAAPSLPGPDFSAGVALDALADGESLLGHVGEEAVLLVRHGDELLAVGANCSHYGGPLAEGLIVGDTVRCPWHHACFSLRTGAALRAPALASVSCWQVEQRDGRAFIHQQLQPAAAPALSGADLPASIVIVGGGAAGFSAAQTLREEGYAGPVTVLSVDAAAPCDRPNLSKDYLAGTAEADWIPLRGPDWYTENRIDLRLGARVSAIETSARAVLLADGSRLPYGALLLATGAEPVRLDVPGADAEHVRVLRTLADCDALIARLDGARRCVVIGASFIGLEAAAALRTRELEVHVIGREQRPMERVMGAEIGDMVQALHEQHGVVFHFGATVTEIAKDSVTLSTGEKLDADLVVVGIGVRPALTLASDAGLAIDRGVVVDKFLQTSVAGVYAAGDIARWPDRHTGQAIRVEHWVVAERQGKIAALNMLGRRQRFDAVPFFWSQHYDVAISYVGHAESWDRVAIDGDPASQDCAATFWKDGRKLAVVTVGRDLDSLRAEHAFERAAGT
jgi:3-phenylpropionate/trans-cinnamate dioxygenase ferredoxin reductase subunit